MLRKAVLALGFLAASGSLSVVRADWDPASFADETLLEFFTVNEEGEKHWATVYFVEIDGDLYVRLGAPAEIRIRENVNKPYVDVRIGDQVFERIVAKEVPEKISEVVDRIYEKYWTSLFIKMMPDRFTVRLRQESGE